MPWTVLIAHAEGDEHHAERIAAFLCENGYKAFYRDSVLVGESIPAEIEKQLACGGPVVFCGTVRSVGTRWPAKIIRAAQIDEDRPTVFPAQIEADADVDRIALGVRPARCARNFEVGLQELLAALQKYFPNDENALATARPTSTTPVETDQNPDSTVVASTDEASPEALPQKPMPARRIFVVLGTITAVVVSLATVSTILDIWPCEDQPGQPPIIHSDGHSSVPNDRASGPETASLVTLPKAGFAPMEVIFTASPSLTRYPDPWQIWTFGDGDSATGLRVKHKYSQPGLYRARFMHGHEDEMSSNQSVLVPVLPRFILAYVKRKPHAEEDIVFVEFTASADGRHDWLNLGRPDWDFGDGYGAQGWRVSHCFGRGGVYTITLSYTISGITLGCSSTMIEIEPLTPTTLPATTRIDGVIGADTLAGFAPLHVSLIASRSSEAALDATYYWSFGDGSSAFGESVSHTFSEPALYTVRMVESDVDTVLPSVERVIPVLPEFTLSHGDPTGEFVDGVMNVSFDASTAKSYSWIDRGTVQWDFGDGDTAEGWSVTHGFRRVGTYTVALSFSIAGVTIGCSTAQVTIDQPTDGTPPVANAGPDTAYVDTDDDGFAFVVLAAYDSYDPDGSIVEYRWTSGGKQLYKGLEVLKLVEMPLGTHEVKLSVTDNDGLVDTDTLTLVVRSRQHVNVPPTANAGGTQFLDDLDNDGFEAITLNGSRSSDSDGFIRDYRWTERGEELASDENAVSTVTLAVGVHDVMLEVEDDLGAVASDTTTITVRAAESSGSTLLDEDFEGKSPDMSMNDWFATGANNSLVESSGLFHMVNISGTNAYGTDNSGHNMHAHYVGPGAAQWRDYQLTGRMYVTASGGGIGFTVLSQYPAADKYYRLRSYRNSPFELSAHGTSLNGVTSSSVVPQPNTWYLVRMEVEDTCSATNIRAKVWAQGGAEPSNWQLQASDSSATRLTHGTIGVWCMDAGEKVVDDLHVMSDAQPVRLVANAGSDQSVTDNDDNGSETVTLDGSGSCVTVGSIAQYRWSEGNSVIASGSSPAVNVVLGVGSHRIRLWVVTDSGNTATDAVLIRVEGADRQIPNSRHP